MLEIKTKYLHCTGCGLYKTRKCVVLGRGTPKCDVLFIGEAPGKSEDTLGIPFIGPAGKVLDTGINLAAKWAGMEKPPTFYITNTVACRPTDSPMGENRPPSGEEIWACYQRLEWECKRVADPKFVVFLGKVAEASCKKLFPKALSLQHPAYILRCGGIGSPAGIKFTRDLSSLFKEIKREKSSEENQEAESRKPVRVYSGSGRNAIHAGGIHPMPCGKQTRA